MSKNTKNEAKRRNISINTEEPLDEERLDLSPLSPLPDEEDEDEKLDEDEVDPFGDKWEQ